MGHDAVVIADSTSRWAEALRELASRTGELPAEEGYPAGLASALAAFYERAGSRPDARRRRSRRSRILGAVSPPGGDMTEPVTAHTRRFVRSRLVARPRPRLRPPLPGRELARLLLARRRPARRLARRARRPGLGRAARRGRCALLAEADRLESVAQLVGADSLPDQRAARRCASRGCCARGSCSRARCSDNDQYSSPGQAGGAARRSCSTSTTAASSCSRAGTASPSGSRRSTSSAVLRARYDDAAGRRRRGRADRRARDRRRSTRSERVAVSCARADRVPLDRLDPRAADRRRRTCSGVGWDETARGHARARARSGTASCSTSTATSRWSRSSRAPPACGSTRRASRSRGAPMQIPVGEGWLGRDLQRARASRSTAARPCSAASSARSPALRSTPRRGRRRASRSSPA